MPLYEFYCEPCHTVFTFRSLRVDTATVPPCPACGAKLQREVSAFAHIVKGQSEAGANEDGDAASRMDQVMAQMGDRLQALDDADADPREAVQVMRELATAGGVSFNREVQEAMARIEAGEDPEKIDETFRDVFDSENPFADSDDASASKVPGWWRRLRDPARDPNWHDLNN